MLVEKNHSLLVAKFARYSLQKLLVAKNHPLFVAKFARYSLQKLLVAKNHSLLVTKFDRYLLQKLLVAKHHLFLVAKMRSLLVAKFLRYSSQKLLVPKNHWFSLRNSLDTHCKKQSLLKQSPAGIIVCLKSTKLDESFVFFNINYFLGKICKWVKSQQLLALSQRNE